MKCNAWGVRKRENSMLACCWYVNVNQNREEKKKSEVALTIIGENPKVEKQKVKTLLKGY